MSAGRLTVRVHAGARRQEVAVTERGTVVVRVSAPALEGRANRATARLLAKRLGVAPTRVSIIRGAHARDKVLEIDGIEQAELDRLLSALS